MHRLPDIKTTTKIINEYLKKQNIEIKHSQILELIARTRGYDSYNTMAADNKKNNIQTPSTLNTNYQPCEYVDQEVEDIKRAVKTLTSEPSEKVKQFYKLLMEKRKP